MHDMFYRCNMTSLKSHPISKLIIDFNTVNIGPNKYKITSSHYALNLALSFRKSYEMLRIREASPKVNLQNSKIENQLMMPS